VITVSIRLFDRVDFMIDHLFIGLGGGDGVDRRNSGKGECRGREGRGGGMDSGGDGSRCSCN